MSSLLRIALEGAFTNFKRIFFAADRVTDMDMRNQIATLSVKVDDRVDEKACIGCAGCANVCPTGAIEMKELANPVKITDVVGTTVLLVTQAYLIILLTKPLLSSLTLIVALPLV